VIVMTSGPSQPERCATPFFMAALFAAMDADVTVYFTMEGIRLVQPGVAEGLSVVKDGKRVIEFMRDAKNAGAKFRACAPSMPGFGVSPDALIGELDEVTSGGALADLILEADKVLTF
jgi:predicted peroxiredoxin